MPIVEPPEPRYLIEKLSDQLIVRIASRRHWLTVLYFAGILFFFVWMLAVMAASFIRPTGASTASTDPWILELLSIIFLVGLAIGCVLWSLSVLLWQVAGKEIIRVSRDALIVSREVLVLRRAPRECSTAHIKNLRVVALDSPYTHMVEWLGLQGLFFGASPGSIAFDYGARSFRFGEALEKVEAEGLLTLLKKRFAEHLAIAP